MRMSVSTSAHPERQKRMYCNLQSAKPVELFQSPAEKGKAAMKMTKARPLKEEVQVLHKKGTFLALMADDGSFFLCRATQDVAQDESGQFKLNWLSITKPPNTYKLDYLDKAGAESILTNVKMDSVAHNVFHLPTTEEKRIKAQLNKTLKYLAGEKIEEDFEEENQSDDLFIEASQFLPSITPVSPEQLMGPASSASLSLTFSQQPNNQRQLRSQAHRASKSPESSKQASQSCHSLSLQQSSQADTASKPLESRKQLNQAHTASNWLSITEPPNTYKLNYMDKAGTESILTNVKMDSVAPNVFHLPSTEETCIKAQLHKTLKYLAGEKIEEDFEEENQSDDIFIEGPDVSKMEVTESKAHAAIEEEMLFIEVGDNYFSIDAVMDSELEEEDGTLSYEMFPALSKTSSSGTIANGNQEDEDAHVKEASQFLPSITPVLPEQLMGPASSVSLSRNVSQQPNNQLQLRSQAHAASKPPESSKQPSQSCHSLSLQPSSQADTASKPLESRKQLNQAHTASKPLKLLQQLRQAHTTSKQLESLQQLSRVDTASKSLETSKHASPSYSLSPHESLQQSSQADTDSKPIESLQQSSRDDTASKPLESSKHTSPSYHSQPHKSFQHTSQSYHKQSNCHNQKMFTCTDSTSVHNGVQIPEQASDVESEEFNDLRSNPPQNKSKMKKYSKPSRTCPFCCKNCGEKLSRHITKKHKHETKVKEALKLPKKERDAAMANFKKEGILHVNRQQLNEDNPQFQRERKTKTKHDMTICGLCKGFFAKPYFKRHKKHCQGDTAAEACAIPVSLLVSDVHIDKEIPEFTQEILSKFREGDVGELCRSDKVIVNFGKRVWMKERSKQDKRFQVRKGVMAQMRQLASLYAAFRKQHEVDGNGVLQNGNAADMFDRRHFEVISEAIRVYTSKQDGSLKPGLKMTLYYLIKLACKVMKATHLAGNEDEAAAEVDKFIAVLELNKDFLFGDATYAINKNRQVKLRKPEEMPLEEDMEKLRSYTVDEVEDMINDEFIFKDAHNFRKLRDLTVTRLTLFNARRGGEPCRLKINEWQEAKEDVWIDKQKADAVDDPLHREMLDSYKVTYQTGKGNNHLVPILFPKDTVDAMNRLCDNEAREMAGIPNDNMYVFACTQNSSTHVSGWLALNTVCKEAGIQNKARINATKNRHRVSTMYAALELPEAKRALFFKHMGHSAQINENIYQAPLAIQEITHVGSVLHHIDAGEGNYSLPPASSEPSGSVTRSRGNRKRRAPLESDSDEPQATSCPPEKGNRKRRAPLESDSDEAHATSCPPEKARNYTRWSPADEALVVHHFNDIIKGNSSRSIPGRDDVEPFLKAHKLLFSWESIRNKVMNERVKWQRLLKKRADSIM